MIKTFIKPLLCVVLTLVFVVGLGACGNDTAPRELDETEDTETAIDESAWDEHEQENPKEPITEPAVNEELAARLTADIQAVADSSGMDVGCTVIDLTSGTQASLAGSQPFASASMINLIVAETFLGKCNQGVFSLDDTYALRVEDIVGGTGSLQGWGAGATLTYRELVQKMISESDNTAANVLIDTLGMDAVNAEAQRLGLTATQLNRKMMDLEAQAAGRENYTSADDVAALLRMVWDKTFVSEEASMLVLTAMENQTDMAGIRVGLPADVVFAHKTGSLTIARHDGGIAEGDKPFILVVLCGGNGFYEAGALETMAKIGSVVYADLA